MYDLWLLIAEVMRWIPPRIYVHSPVHIYVYIDTYKFTYVYTDSCMICGCSSLNLCTKFRLECMYIHMYIYVNTFIRIHRYLWIYICIHRFMYDLWLFIAAVTRSMRNAFSRLFPTPMPKPPVGPGGPTHPPPMPFGKTWFGNFGANFQNSLGLIIYTHIFMYDLWMPFAAVMRSIPPRMMSHIKESPHNWKTNNWLNTWMEKIWPCVIYEDAHSGRVRDNSPYKEKQLTWRRNLTWFSAFSATKYHRPLLYIESHTLVAFIATHSMRENNWPAAAILTWFSAFSAKFTSAAHACSCVWVCVRVCVWVCSCACAFVCVCVCV